MYLCKVHNFPRNKFIVRFLSSNPVIMTINQISIDDFKQTSKTITINIVFLKCYIFYIVCQKISRPPEKMPNEPHGRVATPRLKTSALNHQGNTENWTTMINIM